MNIQFLKRTKRYDVLARWFITLGGISIIGSMLVMILFMFKVTMPLFKDATSELKGYFTLENLADEVVDFAPGPYLERGFAVLRNGDLVYFNLTDGAILEQVKLTSPGNPEAVVERMQSRTREHYNLFWSDGSISAYQLAVVTRFDDEGVRELHMEHELLGAYASQNQEAGLIRTDFSVPEEKTWVLARLTDKAEIEFVSTKVSEDFLGNVSEEKFDHVLQSGFIGKPVDLALSNNGHSLYVASDAGELAAWNTRDPEEPQFIGKVKATDRPITAMRLLFGDVTLVVADMGGKLSAWNVVPGTPPTLGLIHNFQNHKVAISQLETSYKDKSFLSLDVDGNLHMNHLTSERLLLNFEEDTPLARFSLAERGDGLLGRDQSGAFWLWDLHVPHPEISWKTLWGKPHYEGYPEPVHSWQSSSASDDFEPKLSLAPLLWGSLKGTFYGMLFSLPLAFFAAIYTSYMMHPRWRAYVKPIIELMAAVPSVVTGFLAALWLAPRLENNLVGLLCALFFMPLFAGAGLLWIMKRKRKISGFEFLWSAPFLVVGAWLSFQLGDVLQHVMFDGNLNLWLFQNLGLSVDQRNCVVIGFALGFAVIPIIFTISEDALHNVPKHLSAAALALGSSRWQAMRRVILPMASPGIFAAIMIGLGRAVGETMIVLMATGNTPIMSPSILNGMRTLSANIAVEIPEAPVDSTLYRVLFLSAVLLFSMTFVVNTMAEVVRVRLKKKYKNL